MSSVGDKILIKVLNWYGSGSHFERSYTVRNSGGGNGGGDQGGNTQPQRDPIPFEKIKGYAVQQSNTVANRVANTYGKIENWKYNFQRGYWNGVRDFGSFRNSRNYFEGDQRGENDGDGAGTSAGRNQAASDARAQAIADAVQRFRAVMDTNNQPNTELVIPAVKSPSFPAPKVVDSRTTREIEKLDELLSRELSDIRFGDDTYYVVYSRDLFGDIYITKLSTQSSNSSYSFVDSYIREEYAYNEWVNNRLGGGYDYNIYNKMDSSERSTFRRLFKENYDQVINYKFYSVRNANNYAAYHRGEYYGEKAASELAFGDGYQAGYSRSYNNSARDAYRNLYGDYYSNQFNSSIQSYLNGPVISEGSVTLFDENQNGAFELGEKIGVRVSGFANYGRVASKLGVSVSGSGLTSQGSDAFDLGASSSQKTPFESKLIAQIGDNVEADIAQSINVTVGSKQFSLSYTVSFRAALLAFANANGVDRSSTELRQYILDNIRSEWTRAERDLNNVYEGQTSKLAQLVNVYKSLDSDKKQAVLGMKAEILAMKDVTTSGFFSKWKLKKLQGSFTALVNQLQ